MAARFNKVIDIFVRNHHNNPKPNILLFASIGGVWGQYHSAEEDSKNRKICRKLDIEYTKNFSTHMTESMFIMANSGLAGAFYGWSFGPILFPALVVGVSLKGFGYAFDCVEKILAVN